MPHPLSTPVEDPFQGLLMPIEAWKAIHEAQIMSLEHLKALAPSISKIPSIDPETGRIIKDRLERFAARRTIRVRLIFPKQQHRITGRK